MQVRQNDEMILFTVIETYKFNLLNTLRVDFDTQILDEANENLIENTNKFMKEIEQQTKDKLGPEIKVTTVVLEKGIPRDAICEAVEHYQVDTLILGSRGVSALHR